MLIIHDMKAKIKTFARKNAFFEPIFKGGSSSFLQLELPPLSEGTGGFRAKIRVLSVIRRTSVRRDRKTRIENGIKNLKKFEEFQPFKHVF